MEVNVLNEVICKSDILNKLFTENDFNFLKDADKEIERLHDQIEVCNEKREFIVNYINKIEDTLQLFESNSINEGLVTQRVSARKAFEKVNENIKNLYSLEEKIHILEKAILELIVSLESSQENDVTYSKIDEIRNMIIEYSEYTVKIQKENFINDLSLETFFKNANTSSQIQVHETPFLRQDSDPIFMKKNAEENLKSISSDTISPDVQAKELAILSDNKVLRISERDKMVYLPYSKNELDEYLRNFPEEYSSYQDVINQEFIYPLFKYSKHPILARFRETYSLIRDREMKSVIEALKIAVDLMFKHELNPAIIAACKSEKELLTYLDCLALNNLDDFKYFTIKFEITPFNIRKIINNPQSI